MISRGGPLGPRHGRGSAALRLLLAASARLYSALLVLYPKAFRRRYSEEMRRDFRELMREGLEEGGPTELVRVWAQAHSDLVLTALKERGTTSARRASLKRPSSNSRRWNRLGSRGNFSDLLSDIERTERELLDEEVGQVQAAGGAVAQAHLRMGEAAQEIVALGEEIGAGLIVMGSRDRGGMRGALMGSVSESVMQHAHCPVLVVRE